VILNDRVIFTGIIHDLTNVKKAEDEIKVLNKKLEKKVVDRTYELEKTVNKLLSTNSQLNKEVTERLEAEGKLRMQETELKDALNKEKELNELKSRFVARRRTSRSPTPRAQSRSPLPRSNHSYRRYA